MIEQRGVCTFDPAGVLCECKSHFGKCSTTCHYFQAGDTVADTTPQTSAPSTSLTAQLRAKAVEKQQGDIDDQIIAECLTNCADFLEKAEKEWLADRDRWQAQTEALASLISILSAGVPLSKNIADEIEAILAANTGAVHHGSEAEDPRREEWTEEGQQ